VVQVVPETQNCANPTSRDFLLLQELPIAKNSNPERRPQGFPAQISSWCKKLKIDFVKTPFPMSAPRGAETEIPINATNFVGHDYDKTPVVAWQPLAQPPKEG